MTGNLHFALDGGWQVLWVSLLLGAGLPLLFALGVRSLAWGQAGTSTGTTGSEQPHAAGKLLAGICFAVIVACVALGITVIVAGGMGKEVSFEHGYPTLVPKS